MIKLVIDKIRNKTIHTLSNLSTQKIIDKKIILPNICGIEAIVSEGWMVKLLQELLLADKGVFVDVGVNLGQTLAIVKCIDYSRIYVGFEPNPACVFYVKRLVEVNHFKNCTIIPVGLSSKSGLGILHCIGDKDVDSAGSLLPDFRPDQEITNRIFVPLFDYGADPSAIIDLEQTVGIIKIDVEGAELDVVRTLYPIIKRDFPNIILEVLPAYSCDNFVRIRRQNELQSLLHNIGYQFYRITDKSDQTYDLNKIDDIGIHDKIEWSNYLLVHKEIIV